MLKMSSSMETRTVDSASLQRSSSGDSVVSLVSGEPRDEPPMEEQGLLIIREELQTFD